MDDLVSLCARRGFIFASSEIYGGINGFWDYGPLGVELKNNLKARWWQRVVRERDDVEGLDSSIICHPRTWEASGHVEHFSDPMVDCRACKKRFRADQLGDAGKCSAREGSSEHDFTEPRNFNLMLQTRIGASEEAASVAYLRAETCQSIFTDFKRVREVARQKLPFGIAQIGKAFRNEINPRNFTFRSREFEQAEMEFFCHPSGREQWFAHWLDERMRFHKELGVDEANLRTRPHEQDELAHYANQAVDVEYRFPFGWQEIEGIHDRGDWDLSRHGEYSGKDLAVTDPDSKERVLPLVIETSVGVDRTCLALLCDAYCVEELEGGDSRTVLRLDPALAPLKAAVLPLSKKLADPARRLYRELQRHWNVFYDDAGNIGRRYRRQDEAGTPFCLTYDFESEDDGQVTARERDAMTQIRLPIEGVVVWLRERLEARA
ncbi:MAG: glycine--tRNA ligase [Deltaproteobacteria bacterium]|nr:glycine--tRNA ligase [Deltaproteobacteria bacterium]MBW2360359.1 glycine--tRNA ligase [Deltaproteobacteria bacterium]